MVQFAKMTLFWRTFSVFLLFVGVYNGSVLGDVDNAGSSECPIQDQEQMNLELKNGALKCLLPASGDTEIPNFLNNPDDVEHAGEFFKNYCNGSYIILNQCLEGVKTEWNKCHDDLEHNDFELIKDLLKNIAKSFCSEHGKKLLKVWRELQPNPEYKNNFKPILTFLTECVEESGINIYDASVPINLRIFVVYGRMKIIRKCLIKNGKDVYKSIKEIHSIISEISGKMKCHHPERKGLVLCSSLNDAGDGDRKCRSGSKDNSEHTLSRVLMGIGFQCLSFGNQHFKRTTNNSVIVLDELVRFFNESCSHLPNVRECLSDLRLEAEVCLKHPSRHHIFKVFQEMLELTVETGCSVDGRRLAQVYFTETSAEDADAVGECIDISVTRFKHVPVAEENVPDLSLRAYREANRLEQCFLRGLGHETAGEMARTVMDDIVGKMQCVDPVNGDTILCKTMESNTHTGWFTV